MPSALRTTDPPWADGVTPTTLNTDPSTSLSLASTSIGTAVSSSVVAVSFCAVGGSFSGVTVTVLCPTFVKTNVARDGRITAGASGLAEKLMDLTGLSPDKVAAHTLDAHDARRLYVVPQLDATVIWHLKRHFPAVYAYGAGLLGRLLPDD